MEDRIDITFSYVVQRDQEREIWQKLDDIEDIMRLSNLYLTGTPQAKNRENKGKPRFKEGIAECFLNMKHVLEPKSQNANKA